MTKLLALSFATISVFTPYAYGKCEGSSKTIFACTTIKGKFIEVCDARKVITYSFGGSSQINPEIMLKVPRDKVTTFQWAGAGRYLSYSVDIPNGSITYSIFSSMDRLTESHELEAGVTVREDGKLLATIKCRSKKIINNLEGLDLKPSH